MRRRRDDEVEVKSLGEQLPLWLEQRPNFDRDRFIVTAANRETVETLDAWPSSGKAGTLALIGPPGCGKSHLAAAWAARTGAQTVSRSEVDTDAGGWLQGPLLLEDADQCGHGEGFFHLLNAAERPGSNLLITGRTRPATWPVQVQDVRSRLNAAPVIELSEPDEEILTGMLVKLFKQRNIRAPDDLLAYLILRMERSAAAAAGIVKVLDEVSLADQRAVSRVLARQLLKDEADEADPTPSRQ